MKRITFLGVLLLCFTFAVNAQTPQLVDDKVEPQDERVNLTELLQRYESMGSSSAEVTNLFTPKERAYLKRHFNQTANRSSMAVDYTVDQTGTFNPIDISATGTEVMLGDDDGTGPIAMGFTFSFIGNDYTDIYISSNGYLTFDPADVTDFSDDAIPDPILPNNIIAVVWDDLDPGNGGQPAMNVVRYSTEGTAPNRIFVVEYFNVDQFPSGNNVTTQAQLYEGTNVIEIHTTTKPDDGGPSTQGIENFDGSDGLAVPGRNNQNWDVTNDFVAFIPTGGPPPGGPVLAYGYESQNQSFVEFDTTSPDNLTLVAASPNDPATNFEGAGAIDPMGPGTTAYAATGTNQLYSIDVATGTYTLLGTLTAPGGGGWVGMAFDPTSGTLYGLSGNFAVDNTVSVIDIGALTATPLPNNSVMGNCGIALAIDGAGDMFAYDVCDDNFYQIDKTTGIATLVGPINFDANFGQGMSWDPTSDTVYMSAFDGGAFEAQLRTVNTATGDASNVVGTLGATSPGGLVQVAWLGIPATVVLDNDTCAGATPIACGETLSGDTSDGNTDTNGAQYPNLLSPDEWFAFTSTVAGEIVTVSTCNQAGYDTRLSVYDDCTLVNQIAENDDGAGCSGFTSELSFVADGSSTYYIAVDGFNGATGTFDLSITCELTNDQCVNATPIACGETLSGDTSNDTDTNGDGSPDEWFEVTSSVAGELIVVSTCDQAGYDTILTIYDSCGGAVVATNDDGPGCSGFTSELFFLGDGSSTYYIAVDGFGGASGTFDLSVTCSLPPPNDMIVNSIDVDEIGFPYTDPSVAMPAATLENGNPTGCNIDGAKGVWYNFVSAGNGTATAEIVSPAGASFVVFFTAPDEMAIETDLEYFFQIGNQCAPGTSASINTAAGQAYYVFVVNDGGVTDIVIDGTLLSTDENFIQGFSFYPNPTDDTLNLSSVESIEDVAIYNLLGQQVISQNVNATSLQLDMSSLATGAYLMKVTVNGQTGTYKVIKR